jgi:Helix-turn-helix domain
MQGIDDLPGKAAFKHGGPASLQRAEPDQVARGSMAGQTQLYTLPQAAVALDRAEVTLRRWVRKGLIPYVLINGRYYFERTALLAFIVGHTHPASDARP